MDIKIVGDTGSPIEAPREVITTPVNATGGSQPDELYQREVGKLMGLENESDFNKYQPNLKTLVDYAKSQTTDHSPENLKWIVRSLNAKLGSPPFGEDRIKFISRYTYLLNESKRIDAEKKKFEGI
jgi:hypothetical protein